MTVKISELFATNPIATPGATDLLEIVHAGVSGGVQASALVTPFLPVVPLSIAQASKKWLDSYSAGTGLFTASQPDYSDLSGVPSTFPITTPGTLTISTTNDASGNHTHALTASSDVSAGTSALLKSNSGNLAVQTLAIGELGTVIQMPLKICSKGVSNWYIATDQDAFFGGHLNNFMAFGWNVTGISGSREVNTEASMALVIESDFWTDAVNHYIEWYAEYVSDDGTFSARPFQVSVNRADNKAETFVLGEHIYFKNTDSSIVMLVTYPDHLESSVPINVTGSIDAIQLRARAYTGQSNDVAQFQDASSNRTWGIDKDGKIIHNNTTSGTSPWYADDLTVSATTSTYGTGIRATTLRDGLGPTFSWSSGIEGGVAVRALTGDANTRFASAGTFTLDVEANVGHVATIGVYGYGIDVQFVRGGSAPTSAVVGTGYGVHINNFGGAGTYNACGLYIEDQSGAYVTNYAIYTNAGLVRFGDNVSITSTAPVLSLVDTTASAKSLKLTTDANLAKFEEVGGAAANLLVLDLANARVGIVEASPTARLHLPAGTATANTAPLKFTTGNLLTSVEAGAMEFYNNSLWFTNLAVRRTVTQAEEIIVSDITVANTTTETEVISIPHGANYLRVGKCEEISILGIVSSIIGAGANTLTGRVKYAGSTIATFVMPEANRTNVGFEFHVRITCRAIGAGTTSIQIHANMDIEGTLSDPIVNTLATGLDSTTSQALSITVQWSDASTSNSATILQGFTLCIDDN